MMNCPKCDAEMHENQPFCFQCGYSKKYLKSNSLLAKYFNARINLLKTLGIKRTLIYLICFLINFAIIKVPLIIKNNLEFRRLKAKGLELDPPWIKYPEIKRASIGWRMSYGEYYLMKWDRWYTTLLRDDRSQYRNRFPEPEGWIGFYSSREN